MDDTLMPGCKVRHLLLVLSLVLTGGLLMAATPTLVPAFDGFTSLDAKVRTLAKPATPEQLADKLGSLCRTDWERTRAIYVWLTENVAYDVDGFFGRKKMVADASSTFASGRAVCQGYSELFTLMAKRLGLQCLTVSGYAKGYGFQPGQAIKATNHAWNMVAIEGNYYLFDATWGAGALGGSTFVKRFTNAWFATDPRLFVVNHLPEKLAFELLSPPQSLASYQSLPYYEAYLIDSLSGVGLSAPQQLKLLKTASKDFILGIPRLAEGGFSPDEIVSLATCKSVSATFGYQAQSLVKVGVSNADIVAATVEGNLPMAYDLPALELSSAQIPVVLIAGETASFELVGPNIEALALINGGKWDYLQKNGESFSLDYTPVSGKVMLALKIKGQGNSYTGLVEYQVK